MLPPSASPLSKYCYPCWWPRVLLGVAAILLITPLAARAQDAASVATLYTFGPDRGAFNPNTLIRGDDGNFYGTTLSGTDTYYGTVFQFTAAGALTVLHRFASGDGIFPSPGLIQGSDGNLYGTTIQDGPYYGLVFQVTPSGQFRNLHNFSTDDGGTHTGVVQGRDGNLYGATGSGMIYRVSPAGSFTVVAKGLNAISGLILGRDGNFYGTDTTGGFNDPARAFFRATPSGVVTILGTFPSGNTGPASVLTEGSDGNFYGTTPGYVNGDTYGAVFKFSPTGTFTFVHRFPDSGYTYPTPSCQLTQGSDGNFYGANPLDGLYDSGTIFRITPGGDFTSLYAFDGDDGAGPDGIGAGAALLPDGDGGFLGTATGGGSKEAGTIFKLTIQPDFFAGAGALTDDVYYLAFPDGSPFGYYSFLSDPHYLYHFDLGYEYVFNADDGRSGVYLYDFASQTYFYTSPGFPFPYLYDFTLHTVLYYYPDPNNAGHYNTDGVRYFYDFATGKVITK